jgi:hypothetical protein
VKKSGGIVIKDMNGNQLFILDVAVGDMAAHIANTKQKPNF